MHHFNMEEKVTDADINIRTCIDTLYSYFARFFFERTYT